MAVLVLPATTIDMDGYRCLSAGNRQRLDAWINAEELVNVIAVTMTGPMTGDVTRLVDRKSSLEARVFPTTFRSAPPADLLAWEH